MAISDLFAVPSTKASTASLNFPHGIARLLTMTTETVTEAANLTIQRGRYLEYLTMGWNSLEGFISLGAGLLAGSIALVGFGVASIVEVSSGGILCGG